MNADVAGENVPASESGEASLNVEIFDVSD